MRRQKYVITIMLGLAGAAFLVLGLLQGDYQTTLQKAVRLCLECVGIG